jgi:hypothetical protein
LVTPAASDHLLCQASPACACDVHRVRLGAAGSPFAHLAQRRRNAHSSLRLGMRPAPCCPLKKLFWTGVILNVELLYDLSLTKEVPQFKIENFKFNIHPQF